MDWSHENNIKQMISGQPADFGQNMNHTKTLKQLNAEIYSHAKRRRQTSSSFPLSIIYPSHAFLFLTLSNYIHITPFSSSFLPLLLSQSITSLIILPKFKKIIIFAHSIIFTL